jgi:hypothetical protein
MSTDLRLLSCPSAQPDQEDAAVIGIVRRTGDAPLVEALPQRVAVAALIDLIPSSVRPTEILRFSGPCVAERCVHFDQNQCQLAKRIVSSLPEVVTQLKLCAIRPTCRWWHQEGPDACRRCPQIVTEPYVATALMREVARPSAKGDNDYVGKSVESSS